MEKIKEIEEINLQKEYIGKVKKINENKNLKYSILTRGCQLNENDSEKLCGMLEEMGYTKTENQKEADLALFNTCCVRENAEDKLFGKLGELKKLKEQKGIIIAIGGCMMQEKHITDKIKESYPFVDILFGTHTLHKFPEDLYKVIDEKRKLEDIIDIDGKIYEGLPIKRDSKIKASVTIMNGCNNFCTYCIVPYVRGRERSRMPKDIIEEVKSLAKEGYKEITLLGQNVNSYLREENRKGIEIEVPKREIEIYNIELLSINENDRTIEFKVHCSKGTYIRTLCENIAESLETIGYMKELNRIQVGKFNLNQAITIEELEENRESEKFWNQHLITIQKFFENYPIVNLKEEKLSLFLNGVQLTNNNADGLYQIKINENVIGIGKIENKLLKREIIY